MYRYIDDAAEARGNAPQSQGAGWCGRNFYVHFCMHGYVYNEQVAQWK